MYELVIHKPDVKARIRTSHETAIRDNDWAQIVSVLARILDDPEVKSVEVKKVTHEQHRKD